VTGSFENKIVSNSEASP